VEFTAEKSGPLLIRLENLSGGEKMLVLWATLLAWGRLESNGICLWDEVDAHVSLVEIQRFVRALRSGIGANGQFLVTSHSPEAIRSFSRENTFVLRRGSHMLPTQPPRLASELDLPDDEDLAEILARGDEV
jgi:predicted ATP-binding protein involved in virulence